MSKTKKKTTQPETCVRLSPIEIINRELDTSEGGKICITNKIRKRNTFMGDAVRIDRDTLFLNAEIGQRKYKDRIKTITTIKHCEVNKDDFWVTEFIIDLKPKKG